MCYSSLVEASNRKLARTGATEKIRRDAMNELLRRSRTKLNDTPRKMPKWPRALEANFDSPTNPEDARISEQFAEIRAIRRTNLESELFKQRARFVKAERAVAKRETKTALEELRKATNKVEWHRRQLVEFDRRELTPADSRIYPFWYAPVIANVDGERVIMPMRYHCRPNGKPASYDKKFDGLYNARRDSLGKFWKDLFGKRHAVLVAWAFYENVALEDFERRALRPGEKSRNLVLEFKPNSPEPMLLACLWDHWESPGEEDLYSFAAITDEPPSEVAATGHDRCPIPIKPENLTAWLTPEGRSLEELQAILDARERPFYQHRLAA